MAGEPRKLDKFIKIQERRKKAEKNMVKNTPQSKMIEINSNISPSTCINTYKSQKQNVESKRQNMKMYLECVAMM